MNDRQKAYLKSFALNRWFDNLEPILRSAAFSRNQALAEKASGCLEGIEHLRAILEPIWKKLQEAEAS